MKFLDNLFDKVVTSYIYVYIYMCVYICIYNRRSKVYIYISMHMSWNK